MKTSVRWDGSLGELTFLDIPAGDINPAYDGETRLDVHQSHALLNGQPVGVVSIAPYENHPKDLQPGEISMISVNKDFRGNGIGRALVQHAQDIGWDPRHSRKLLSDGYGFVKGTPEFGMVPKTSAVTKKVDSPKCKFCKEKATNGVLWAEGMGVVPACDKHLEKAKDAVRSNGEYGEIDGIKDYTKKSARTIPTFVRTATRWQDSDQGRLEFEYKHVPAAKEYAEVGIPNEHKIIARFTDAQGNRAPVGSLSFYDNTEPVSVDAANDTQPHEISWISVSPDMRGKGIARAMVEHAYSLGYQPVHSSIFSSKNGRGFAEATPEYNARMSANVEDYGMQHRPPTPETGAPLHDLTGGGLIYPDDVYTRPRIYDFGEPGYQEVHQLALRVRGKPEEMVDIYRSGPKPEINPGDWVSPSYENARAHGLHPHDETKDAPVWHARVPAKYLHNAGDSLPEFGYNGPETIQAEPYRR